MMRLDTMQMLVATLDDQGACPIAEAILSRWEHEAGTLHFWRASSNFLFGFKNSGGDFFLRFINAEERTAEAIRAELAFLEHLSRRGIPVVKPVPSLAGRVVETVARDGATWHAGVFERLEGESFELQEMSPERVERWGRALGELHRAAEGYRASGRPSWQDHAVLIAAGLPPEEKAGKAMLNRLQDRLARLPVTSHDSGLIHFDFEPDNLIWKNGQVGMVDFDDCAYYWFAADIAFALRELFGDSAAGVNLQNDSAQYFIRGYRMARAIGDAELEDIPLFLGFHNLVTLARLYHAVGTDAPCEEPEWAAALRNKLWNRIAFYRAEAARGFAGGTGVR